MSLHDIQKARDQPAKMLKTITYQYQNLIQSILPPQST